MAERAEPVRAGQARGPRPHHGHLAACRRAPREGLAAGLHGRVRGIPLEQPDVDRLAFGVLANAGFFAERLDRANARAHAAQDVGRQDGVACPERVVGPDLPDEQRNVDAGRAGRLAGCVIAEVAAVGGDEGLVAGERRRQVGEVAGILLCVEPAILHVLGNLVHAVRPLAMRVKGFSAVRPCQ